LTRSGGRSGAEPIPSSPSRVLEPLPLAVCVADATAPDAPLIYVNEAFESLTGYPRARALGRSLWFLEGERTEESARADLRAALEAGEGACAEITLHTAEGEAFLSRISIAPVAAEDAPDEAPALYLASHQPVDGPGEGAESFNRLAELQHRVKNHLAMVISLIRSQARDSGAAVDLTALGSRVETLQLLYEELAGPHDADGSGEPIPLGAYLSRVASAVAHVAGRPGVRNAVDVDETMVSVGLAGRVGLLVNELLTNAYQHAFEGRATGLVETRVQGVNGGRVRVTMTDDGVGMRRRRRLAGGGFSRQPHRLLHSQGAEGAL
jgi:PAS domain S-box-containing protein